jgi:hypothetical protein
MWELDYGDRPARWAVAADLVWDDFLSPFGCRTAAAAVLSLPGAWRDGGPRLFEELTRRMWPEALEAAVLPKVRLRRRPIGERLRRRVSRLRAC